MDERARRVGENEALYRAINEKIDDLNEAFGTVAGTMSVICECGLLECAEQIEIDVQAYARVRSEPTQFVVVPGHELEDVEHVVERHERFNVVAKAAGGPAELARETDPRS